MMIQGKENFLNLVLEKLKEVWVAMENFWAQFLGWFGKVFPPETRHNWLHIALLLLLILALISMLYCCCKFCLRCCRGGARGGRFRIRMMRAPGRNCRMPRHVFEANPKSYFQRLRAHPGDELC